MSQLSELSPALRRLDFDQLHRYGAVSLLLKPLLTELGRPARMLEVGCNVLNLLPEFLRPHPLELIRCDVEDTAGDDPDFFRIARATPLPFADHQFDYVVALEVLEHVPPEDRLYTLSEWARVANKGLIVTCPTWSEAVYHAEARARQAYEQRNGQQHGWLAEHLEFGLPTLDSVKAILEDLGLHHFTFGNSPLAEWLPLLLLTEELTESASPAVVARFNEFMHERQGTTFPSGETYRHIFACFKSEHEARAAARHWKPIAQADSEQCVEPVVALTHRLRALMQPQVEAWSAVEQTQLLRRQLHATQRTLEEEQARSADRERMLCRQALDLEAAWAAWAGRSPHPAPGASGPRISPACPPIRFTGLHQLRPPPNDGSIEWESLGCDPQVHFDVSLPAGWARLRMVGQMQAGTMAKLYYDDGHGFGEDRCLLLGPWNGPQVIERLHHFAAPVRRLRFDPMETPGLFRLREFMVQPATKLAAITESLLVHFRELRHPLSWLTKPAKLLAVLLQEGPAGLRRRLWNRTPALPRATAAALDAPPVYAAWAASQALSAHDRQAIHQRLASPHAAPRLGVALTVDHISCGELARTLESLATQAYLRVHIVVALPEHLREDLETRLNEFPELQGRTQLWTVPPPCRGSGLLNRMLEIEEFDYVVPIDAGDQLADDALLLLADAIARHPQADVYYSDEDHWTGADGRLGPLLKPDWSPETFLARPYIGRLAAYRRPCCRALGGFNTAFEGAHEFELMLRLMAAGKPRIHHVSRVLYHRTGFPPTPHDHPAATLRALHHHAGWLGLDMARTSATTGPRFKTSTESLVSIVIPTAGKATSIRGRPTHFVRHCVESIRRLTTHARYEIIVVDNGDLTPELATELASLGVRQVTFTPPFNLAAKLNLGASHARGEYLVLLNDDTEVITPEWLECLLEYAVRPEIGAAGPKLLFPDGRLQHVGVVLLDANPSHPWYAAPGEHEGYFRSIAFPRNFLAITGACLMTRRTLFEQVGGFDPRFPLNYNDVDYCLRLQSRGMRCVYTPHAELYHHEAVSKEGGASVRPEELELFHQLWKARYPVDPYYHPLLSPRHCDYRLRTMNA